MEDKKQPQTIQIVQGNTDMVIIQLLSAINNQLTKMLDIMEPKKDNESA